ncbi:hypothetical protein Tcan_13802 [Toxocara canis]|uniref:Uncharacterized protein n=1 Tax=Toxocara canis TaxID=6265 RepID=A0A0B2VPA9_TOXCA|nr:hypothetical protein Tcan_13802 [Toxocara canis]
MSKNTSSQNQSSKSKARTITRVRRHGNRRSTEEEISLIERQIALRRRLSRILNFHELYSDTPCVRVEDISSELGSLGSFDSESEKSVDNKENDNDAELSKDGKNVQPHIVSNKNKADMSASPYQHQPCCKKCATRLKKCTKCSEFMLFRQRIIMP